MTDPRPVSPEPAPPRYTPEQIGAMKGHLIVCADCTAGEYCEEGKALGVDTWIPADYPRPEPAPPRSCCDESFEVQTAVGKVGCPTHFGEFLRKRAGVAEPAPPRATAPRMTFDALRAANTARLPLFKNRKGEPAHSQPDGSDWSLGEWANAVLGELGEAANLIKKVHRGDVSLDEARDALAKEFADVVTYLDILAFRAGVDLGAATAAKWDEVSARVGVPLRIADFTSHALATLTARATGAERGGFTREEVRELAIVADELDNDALHAIALKLDALLRAALGPSPTNRSDR